MYFVCNALGYRLMQLAAKRMGNEGLHTFGAEAISLLLAIGYTFGVRKGKGQDPVRRRENEKCRQKVSQRDQPTNHPTHQTNQPVKTKNFVGPRVGSKESTKAQAS
jgi:hypothetical protein